MEDEIDLGKYLAVLIRQWKWVVGLAALAAIVALGVSFLLPPTYEATASVAIVQTRSDLTFNPNFVTQTDVAAQSIANANALAAILDARRAALEALVVNGNVAAQVVGQIGSQLPPEQRDPATLLDQVQGHAVSKGDLIQITAQSASPDQAALLANTWAHAYEKQVNMVYSESPTTLASVQAQLVTAKSDYDKAQAAYTQFEGRNQVNVLKARQDVVQATLSDTLKLQSGAQNLLLNQQVGAQQALLQQTYANLKDYFTNRLDVEAKKTLLQSSYNTRNRMLQIQADAQAMLDQARSGGSPSASALAQLLLKAEAFSSSTGLPGSLTLQFDAANSTSTNPETLQADLEALVKTLADRLKVIQGDIDRLSLEVFNIPDSTKANDILTQTLRALPQQQLDFERLNTQANRSAVAANEPVSQTIKNLTQEQLDLQRRIELQTAQERELKGARDLAWQSYTTLLSKEAELQITSETASAQVRVAAEAVVPDKPVSPRKGLNTVLGGALGLMVGVVAAFVVDRRRPATTESRS